MDFLKLVKARYSVRKLSPKPVDDAAVQTILEAARVAPTAANKQPQRLLVLRTAESMAKLRECTPYTFDAPMAIAVCADKSAAWVRPYDNDIAAVIDASIVGTHIMLAVHDLGLGSTWVGHFDPAAFRRIYNLPDTVEPVALFPIGHLAPEARPAHLHEKRLPLEATVFYENF